MVHAYLDCRRRKRNTASALEFEAHLERNLFDLNEELLSGEYRPGRSICFVITHPKPREVWAAEFRDRIVHHLVYNHIADQFYRRFITDSCACIPERGTLFAAQRLEAKVRSITQNWRKPAFYLKCDLANFFVSIDKRVLWPLLAEQIPEPWWQDMTGRILWHDPRENFIYKGTPALLDRVPAHKRLTCQPNTHGLPIGNLSSQFFANVLLNVLDQHIKHYIKATHYVRYVDDFVILGRSTQWLEAVHTAVALFLPDRLGLQLNESKTLIYPVDRGIDFVGQIIKPWRRTVRRRVVNYALRRVATIHADRVFETANSYFGLFRQASKSHRDRARLAKVVLRRGHAVDGDLTVASRRKAI